MQSLRRLLPISSSAFSSPSPSCPFSSIISYTSRKTQRFLSTTTGDDEWNDAWETAWLPEDLSAKNRAPWESDVNFPSSAASDIDADTKAFVAEMDERWSERRAAKKLQQQPQPEEKNNSGEKMEEGRNRKAGDDYRVRKQRIHAGLWMKEIEKMEESRLGNPRASDDIDRLLDSCSE